MKGPCMLNVLNLSQTTDTEHDETSLIKSMDGVIMSLCFWLGVSPVKQEASIGSIVS